MTKIAYFVSSHGYGHAARAAAVMLSLAEHNPDLHFHLFTTVPRWFFEECRIPRLHYHEVLTDIGLAQSTALHADLKKTVERLATLIPFREETLSSLAGTLKDFGCQAVICDISPLGISVAKHAALPVVLIENFTWDYIYRGYLEENREIAYYADYLSEIFSQADYHIQTAPFCRTSSRQSLSTNPVARPRRTSSQEIRSQLSLTVNEKLVLLTMGGVPWDYSFLEKLKEFSEATFVIPGGTENTEHRGNLIILPYHSQFYHPDLVASSDVIIGKLGYSTLAEVYWAGKPFGYVERPGFAESTALAKFASREMPGMSISERAFSDGTWIKLLPELLASAHVERSGPGGSEQISNFLDILLGQKKAQNTL